MNNPFLVKEYRKRFMNRTGYMRTLATASGKVEKAELKNNPYFAKYAEKLNALKQ